MPSDYKHRCYSVTVTSGEIISQLLTLLPSIQPVECVMREHGVQRTSFTRGCEYTVDLLLFVMMGIWACGAFKSVNQHCL